MANLAPLPAPGLAILPQNLSNTPLIVTLKGSSWSKDMTATTSNGTLLFTVEGATMSMSHRRSLFDANGQKLFEIRKDGFGTKRYYAEIPETGARLLETETHTKLLHRPRTAVRFANQADPSKQMVELEFVPAGLGADGAFNWSGGQVVLVEKISMTLSGEYQLSIAPGMDPTVVVAVMVAMIDRAKTQSSAASAGAVASTV